MATPVSEAEEVPLPVDPVAEYLDSYQLPQLIQEGATECFLAQSEDPAAYLSAWFHRRGQLNRINRLTALQILDCRGVPTVQVTCHVNGRPGGTAAASAGQTTAAREACELRDGDPNVWGGKSMSGTVSLVTNELSTALKGSTVINLVACDDAIRGCDGTTTWGRLGSHAASASSMSIAVAAAQVTSRPLFALLAEVHCQRPVHQCRVPLPLVTVLDGGRHAGGKMRAEALFIIPSHLMTYSEQLQAAADVSMSCRKVASSRFGVSSLNVGMRGGLTPPVEGLEAAITLVEEAITGAGLTVGEQMFVGIDMAASELYDTVAQRYDLEGSSRLSGEELVDVYVKLCRDHPGLMMLVDPFHEDDVQHFSKLTDALSGIAPIRLVVGDDVFASQPDRLATGLSQQWANAAVIKPNAAGTLSDAASACRTVLQHHCKRIMATRAGDPGGSFEADLAVALHCDMVAFGALTRAENTVKYNRLLEIEHLLSDHAQNKTIIR